MQPLVAGLLQVLLKFAPMAGDWRPAGTDLRRSPFGDRGHVHGRAASSGREFPGKSSRDQAVFRSVRPLAAGSNVQ